MAPRVAFPKPGILYFRSSFLSLRRPQTGGENSVAHVLPVPTHLLTNLDSTVEIVKHYVKPCAQPGDIVTIGETPVAIMQGRLRHPQYGETGLVG